MTTLVSKEQQAMDWRDGARHRTVVALNEVLWDSGRFSDVKFLVGPQEVPIKAHSLMLITRSSVFETMFSSPWTQAQNGDTQNQDEEKFVVKVPDAEPEPFKGFLKFLYTDNTDGFVSPPIEILYLAQKYQVTELVSVCASFLLMCIQASTVIEIHYAAMLFDLPALENATMKFMLENAEAVFRQADCVKLDFGTMNTLFRSDDLNLNEVAAFHAMLKWARGECERQGLSFAGEDLRKVASFIPLIRFPTMTPQDFTNEVVPTKVLTSEEIIKIFVYFNSHELSVCRNPDLCCPFITKPRTCNIKDTNTSKSGNSSVGVYLSSEPCSPISLAYTVTGNLGKIHEESLDFTVDSDIEIIGVGLYGPAPDRLRNKSTLKTYMVDIQLFNFQPQSGTETSLTRALVSRTSQSIQTRSDYDVNFVRPIAVSKNSIHHVRIAFRGQETQHGVSRLSNVSALYNGTDTVTFNFLGPTPIATGQYQGRIRSLIFKPIETRPT